jgi:hypothetical protein
MSGTVTGRLVMPSRRLVIRSLLGALVGGALLGLLIGVLNPTQPSQLAASAVGTPTGSPTGAAGPVAAVTSPTRTVRTVVRTEDPVPADVIEQPWKDKSIFLGKLYEIRRDDHGTTLVMRRATLLTGDKAAAYYAEQGQDPQNTAVVSVDEQPREYRLRDDAALFGTFGDQLRKFNVDDFLGAAQGILDQGTHPAFWVKRSLGVEGSVIYVDEYTAPNAG